MLFHYLFRDGTLLKKKKKRKNNLRNNYKVAATQFHKSSLNLVLQFRPQFDLVRTVQVLIIMIT